MVTEVHFKFESGKRSMREPQSLNLPLLALVRLLARQAARETLSALPTSETSNDDQTA